MNNRDIKRNFIRRGAYRSGSNDIQISKKLSLVLRHKARNLGLYVDPQGFVSLEKVLCLNMFTKGMATEKDVIRVCNSCSKQRFKMKKDERGNWLIRANQGHSFKVENLFDKKLNPDDLEVCVHGTTMEFWKLIKVSGLNKMGRTHIHMIPCLPNDREVISGMKYNCEVFLHVDARKAIEKGGLEFFLSDNNVVLCPGNEDGIIKPEFFKKATTVEGKELSLKVSEEDKKKYDQKFKSVYNTFTRKKQRRDNFIFYW